MGFHHQAANLRFLTACVISLNPQLIMNPSDPLARYPWLNSVWDELLHAYCLIDSCFIRLVPWKGRIQKRNPSRTALCWICLHEKPLVTLSLTQGEQRCDTKLDWIWDVNGMIFYIESCIEVEIYWAFFYRQNIRSRFNRLSNVQTQNTRSGISHWACFLCFAAFLRTWFMGVLWVLKCMIHYSGGGKSYFKELNCVISWRIKALRVSLLGSMHFQLWIHPAFFFQMEPAPGLGCAGLAYLVWRTSPGRGEEDVCQLGRYCVSSCSPLYSPMEI